ncbi:hypothetical protein [Ruminococcus albus]|uniref:Uncharacterized protein n=1 Tax=Ruminococcus albus TaxID=1264 RepID=A0A1I1GX29_RUMAL|nr:hypothetical protein [Ruminococcus albus]SFC16234.1 hypothetical protein SAMN02910406_01254 [Ruminococcus albus]
MKRFIDPIYAYALLLSATICLLLKGHSKVFLIISVVLHVMALIEFYMIFGNMKKRNRKDSDF